MVSMHRAPSYFYPYVTHDKFYQAPSFSAYNINKMREPEGQGQDIIIIEEIPKIKLARYSWYRAESKK